MEKTFRTLDGKIIIVNKETEEHLIAHPEVLPFLKEAISKVTLIDADKDVSSISKEVDFGRNIGTNNLVETKEISPQDKMLFAYRKARKHPTHIVMARAGEDCPTMVIQIKFDKIIEKWLLMTAYIGHATNDPHEPFYISDKNSEEFKKSLEFWSRHALVYNQETMDLPFESTWKDELGKI